MALTDSKTFGFKPWDFICIISTINKVYLRDTYSTFIQWYIRFDELVVWACRNAFLINLLIARFLSVHSNARIFTLMGTVPS